MDKDIRFLVDDIKKEMDNLTQVLTGAELYKYINSITRELMIIGDTDLMEKMRAFKSDQLNLEIKIEMANKELNTLNEEYVKNIKEIINTIKRI